MKKQIDIELIAIFGGGLLFNFLFWNEGVALNLLLHSIFISAILLLNNAHRTNKKTILVGSSHLLAALLVVFNHSVLNIFAYYISLLIFVGFTHATLIKSVFVAMFSGILQIVSSPFNLIKKLISVKIGNYSLKPILRPIKYIVIPIIILLFFSLIYSIANPVFANYLEIFANNIGDIIFNIFTFFFGDLSIDRFIHVILGILFTAGILLAFKQNNLEKIEANLSENLIRKRKSKLNTSFLSELKSMFFGAIIQKKMALKTENIVGIISFAALNLLLLFLNSIDIITIWMGKFDALIGKNYSAELHEGTNALIFSIAMAMAVILYFFNGNLNFFKKNKTIKTLAYLWIIQNAFLVCSVLLRDYNYIAMHGLTYKRIGVFVFLVLCSVGLTTVYLKVAKQKTFFYLFKTNGLIWYVLLLFFGFINWDVFIVSYNINNRNNISLDLDHLLSMSDKTLPLLDKNRTLLKTYLPKSHYSDVDSESAKIDSVKAAVMTEVDTSIVIAAPIIDTAQLAKEKKQEMLRSFDMDLNNRIINFKKEQLKFTWLSWNFRDWQTNQYFNPNK